MTGPSVDTFTARLTQELSALTWQQRNELLVRIGKMELRMRGAGIERPKWRGPLPEERMLGTDVVIPTAEGERRGRVICFGVMHVGAEDWERSVIVHVPSSGTQHEGPGSSARLATPADEARMVEETAMAQRLIEVTTAPQAHTEALRPRKRTARDPKLIDEMLALAKDHPGQLKVEEGGTNYKVSGRRNDRRVYLFRTQLRVDLSGYAPAHAGVRQITEAEARDMHLGKVRGQLTFDDRTVALEAFKAALDGLSEEKR